MISFSRSGFLDYAYGSSLVLALSGLGLVGIMLTVQLQFMIPIVLTVGAVKASGILAYKEINRFEAPRTNHYAPEAPQEKPNTLEHRPDSASGLTFNHDNDNSDDEAEPANDRPFTLEFLKRAAKKSENLDEFLASLRDWKEGAS